MNDECGEQRYWEMGWEGHERAQLQRMALWPLWEKIRWLEEAAILVSHLRQKTDSPASSSDPTRSHSEHGR